MANNKISKPNIMALGAGAIALAASTYYFFGPMGKVHRKKAAGWMIKMKGEIIERLEQAGDMSEETYQSIVDTVSAMVLSSGKVAATELQPFTEMLKSQWRNIVKMLPVSSKNKSRSRRKTVTGRRSRKSSKRRSSTSTMEEKPAAA